jgi:hypothetical protein
MTEPDKKALEDQWLRTWEPTPEVKAIADKVLEVLNDDSLTESEQSAKVYMLITSD